MEGSPKDEDKLHAIDISASSNTEAISQDGLPCPRPTADLGRTAPSPGRFHRPAHWTTGPGTPPSKVGT
jgi:hypothetical protein